MNSQQADVMTTVPLLFNHLDRTYLVPNRFNSYLLFCKGLFTVYVLLPVTRVCKRVIFPNTGPLVARLVRQLRNMTVRVARNGARTNQRTSDSVQPCAEKKSWIHFYENDRKTWIRRNLFRNDGRPHCVTCSSVFPDNSVVSREIVLSLWKNPFISWGKMLSVFIRYENINSSGKNLRNFQNLYLTNTTEAQIFGLSVIFLQKKMCFYGSQSYRCVYNVWSNR